MTWSHFTSYLDGSRPITKAERDELYSQLSAQLDACSEIYTLNSADQTEITGSELCTDRASLDDSSGPTNTVDRLEAILAAVGGEFSNYSTAVSDALTAEGITDTERDDIIAAEVEDWRLWNYYRRVIDALTCACTMAAKTESGGSVDGAGVETYTYDVTGDFVVGHDLTLFFEVLFPDGYAKIEVQADAVEIYDSGCINTSVTTTIAVPAGTTEIVVVVTRQCSGSWAENGWDMTLECA